jgi:trans-aconitate methyltransferase
MKTLNNHWDSSLYQDKHSFVWQYGENLLELLNAKPGECILDLGCGTGQLTEKISLTGAEVMGVDGASEMVDRARQNYPHLKFDVADARNFQVEKLFDAVFSNAVLHWICEPDAVIACIYKALKPGGRFVAEFGGKGNVEAITQALDLALGTTKNPWYFPSIGDYATRLEQQGFDVNYAVLFSRPTPLEGDSGIANWIRMFGSAWMVGLSAEEQIQVIRAVEEDLKPILYREGTWMADYCRIRIVAVKANTK